MNRPLVVLGVIDGFGYSQQTEGNAIQAAQTPNLDFFWSHYPHFLVKAAEEEVGLAFGEVGNSEVGHITIGTGRVIPQNLSLINKSLEDRSFYQNNAFIQAINYTKTNQSNLHIYGLISTAGVHGHLYHMIGLLELAASHQVNPLLHLILDGRDSGPRDAPYYLKEIHSTIDRLKTGSIASITGRAYAMDRNNNWERTQLAYQLLLGKSEYSFNNVDEAVQYFYTQGLDDENIPPTVINQPNQHSIGIKNNEAVIITNFREDRARQITKALSMPTFDKFERANHPENLMVVTMTSYEKALPVTVAYPPPPINNTLSDILSSNQISQIHIAETEKYAHVTYFFNGGRESKRPMEEFFLVPSIKPDQFAANPQMSAAGITKAVIDSINLGYNFIVFNFANTDMIGHTGIWESVVKAVETVDQQFKLIWEAIAAKKGYLIITADHGNCEQMVHPKTKAIIKKHTISPVPVMVINETLYDQNAQAAKVLSGVEISGLLSDISPTVLQILQIPQPEEMTGTSLIAQ